MSWVGGGNTSAAAGPAGHGIAHGVKHEFMVDHGGHLEPQRFARDVLPFFARTLAGAQAGPDARAGAGGVSP